MNKLEKVREEIGKLIAKPPMKDVTAKIGDFAIHHPAVDWDAFREEILSVKIGNITLKELIELKGKLVKLASNQALPTYKGEPLIAGSSADILIECLRKAGFKKVEPL